MTEILGRAVLILTTDSKNLDRGVNKAKKSSESLSKRFRKTGLDIAKIGIPLAAIGVHILKTAANFEAGMNRVQALTSATTSELKTLEEQARQLGGTTQFSASQAADAMGFLAQAGANANEILTQMPATLNLAAAGQIDLAQTADIVTNIMKGYGIEVEETTRVSDVLTAAFTGSNTNLQQLGEAMKFAGPVAAGFGIKFEEAAAAVGLMGNAGFQASLAGTALRGALVRLAVPTDNVAEVMDTLGLNVMDATGNMIPFNKIIEQLETSGATTAQIMEIFGQRAGPAMAALVSQGSEALREFTRVLENSGGRAKEVADVQMAGLKGEIRALISAWQDLELEIAQSGMLADVTKWAKGFVGWLRTVTTWMENTRAERILGELADAKRAEKIWGFFGIGIDLSSELQEKYDKLLGSTFKISEATEIFAENEQEVAQQMAAVVDATKKAITKTAELTRTFNDTDDALVEYGDDVIGFTLDITEMGDGLFFAAEAALLLKDRIRDLQKQQAKQPVAGPTGAGPGGQPSDIFAGIGTQFAGQFAGASGAIAGFEAGGPLGAAAGFFGELLLRNEKMQEIIGKLNEVLTSLLDPIVTAIAPALEAIAPTLIELQPVFEAIGKALAVWMPVITVQLQLVTGALKNVDDALKTFLKPFEKLGESIERLIDSIENFVTGGGAGGDFISSVGSAIGFHSGSGGPLNSGDLMRLPGMASNEGLALLQAGETVLPARSQVTIQLNGDDSTTYSKRQIRSLLSAIREEISDDSTFPLLQVVG